MATRLTAAVLLLALLNACATQRVVRLDTGQEAPIEYRPPTSNKSVRVDAEAFEDALTQWVLNAPLTLRPPQQGGLVRASYPSNDSDTRWQRLMSKSFGGMCEPGQRKESLGVETFLELVDASRELKWATDRATTWEELERASKRFASRVGPEGALEIAESGGRHAGFMRNYQGKPPGELRRGIDSLKK